MPEKPNPALLRQRLLADLKNVELRRKYLATRGHVHARADRYFARRRILIVELLRGMAGLAGVGALGGALGGLMLGNVVRDSGPYAAAFQAGIGSVMVAGTIFAVLGALGYVVFGDVVGDFRAEPGVASPSPGDRFNDVAVEFIGGATWGIGCGLVLGVLAGAVDLVLGITPGPTIAGTAGGALLGLVLAVLAGVFRSIRGKEEAGMAFGTMGPLPFSAYFFSAEAACEQFLRQP